MNSITVDGQEIRSADIAGVNLEEILINLMDHPVISNRVITRVLLNGELYSEEMPHAALEVERGSIGSLELQTHNAEELSLHFFQHGHYFVNMLREALPKIVEAFRLGDESEANDHFLGFLEAFHLVVNMLDQTRLNMGLGEDIDVGPQGTLNGYLAKLSDSLGTLLKLQEQGDWIFLADVLEYELDEALENLGKLLPLLTKAGH